MAERSQAMTQMQRFMEDQKWQYYDEGELLRGLIAGEHCGWHWVAREGGDGRFLMFYAYSPVKVPPKRRAAVAEYLARANWNLLFGNFDMDWSDGQVILRVSVFITSSEIARETLEEMVFGGCYFMDRYLPGILTVALGNAKPAAAIAEAESPGADRADAPDSESQGSNLTSAASQSAGAIGGAGPAGPGRVSGFFTNN